jgi:hypothetical protein
VFDFYRKDRRHFVLSTVTYFVGWCADALEILLVAHLLGMPIDVTQALAIEAFISVARRSGFSCRVRSACRKRHRVSLLFVRRGAGVRRRLRDHSPGQGSDLRGDRRDVAVSRWFFVSRADRGEAGGARLKAIICAAGRGVRLGASTPKILLDVGGRTLLEWHARRLREVGITDVVLVTGHQREQITRALPPIAERYGLTVTERVNERFTEGSVLSVAAALPDIEEGDEPLC